jgi:hypothetical protein
MNLGELIEKLVDLIEIHGTDQQVVIDTGMCLCVVDEVDLGASDEGIIIWAGDLVEG